VGDEDQERFEDEEIPGLELVGSFFCGVCGLENIATLDLSGGSSQEMIQDCDICCHPHRLLMSYDQESGFLHIQAIYDA
jgi:hypothetical protein